LRLEEARKREGRREGEEGQPQHGATTDRP
jgi:hypothetical protein